MEIKNTNKITGKVLLTDAEIVVSGGRGMKGPENWGPIEELAGLLGGATACSRPVSDEGWRSHEEHTGQTGKIIAPNLIHCRRNFRCHSASGRSKLVKMHCCDQ